MKALYSKGDRRQVDALQLYALSINLGAFVAPLVTGALAAFYGWHVGFAFAGFGMLTGLIIYTIGGRLLPPDPVRLPRSARSPLSSEERSRLGLIFMIWPLLACFWVAQSQVWNTYNLWVRDQINLNVGGFTVPVPWLQSIDGLMPAISLPIVLAISKRQAARGSEPELLTKMGIGCLLFGTAVLLLVFASHPAGSTARATILFPIGFHILSNFGWLFFSPVSAALVLTRSPERTRGAMYGIAMLAVTGGSLVSGRLGSLYEKIPAAQFWLIHAAIVGGAGVVFLLLAGPLSRRLPEADEPLSLPAEAIDALPQPA